MLNQYLPAQLFPLQGIIAEAFSDKSFVRVVSGNAESIQQVQKNLKLLAIGIITRESPPMPYSPKVEFIPETT